MRIKMIGLDLDGTTLNSESRLTERTFEAFRKAYDMGTTIVIATGRAFTAVPQEIKSLESVEYIVTSNGARITERKTGKTIRESFIDSDVIVKIHELFMTLDPDIEIFFDGKAYIGKREYDAIMDGRNTVRRKEYVAASRIPVDDIFSLLLENKGIIENINVNYTLPDQKRQIEPLLKTIDNVTLTSSYPLNNEFEGEGTSKGKAMEYIMGLKGFSKDEIMCVGDNPNDIEMIKFAGLGVAVENSEPIVKKFADYITLSNDDDGVAAAIEKFVIK